MASLAVAAFALSSRATVVSSSTGRASSRGGHTASCSLATGLDEAEGQLVQWLSSSAMGQGHLFEGWTDASVNDKRRLLAQLASMDAAYPEDPDSGQSGLAAYVARSRLLLASSSEGKNPYEGYEGEVVAGGNVLGISLTCCPESSADWLIQMCLIG